MKYEQESNQSMMIQYLERILKSLNMIKLFVVSFYIEASSIKEALKLVKNRNPDEVYISEEWFKNCGFLNNPLIVTKGFEKK